MCQSIQQPEELSSITREREAEARTQHPTPLTNTTSTTLAAACGGLGGLACVHEWVHVHKSSHLSLHRESVQVWWAHDNTEASECVCSVCHSITQRSQAIDAALPQEHQVRACLTAKQPRMLVNIKY